MLVGTDFTRMTQQNKVKKARSGEEKKGKSRTKRGENRIWKLRERKGKVLEPAEKDPEGRLKSNNELFQYRVPAFGTKEKV